MQRTLTHALPTVSAGDRVRIEGWVHRRRRLGGIAFLIIRDRTGLAQAVVTDDDARRIDELVEETVVAVEGTVAANGKAPGGVELIDPQITELSPPAVAPPVELWRPSSEVSLPLLLDHAPVLWRHPAQNALWRIATASCEGFAPRWIGMGSSRSKPRRSSARPPSQARTCSAWTILVAPRIWRSPRSCTSR